MVSCYIVNLNVLEQPKFTSCKCMQLGQVYMMSITLTVEPTSPVQRFTKRTLYSLI